MPRQLRMDEAVEGYPDEQLVGLLRLAELALPSLHGDGQVRVQAQIQAMEHEQARRENLREQTRPRSHAEALSLDEEWLARL